MFIPHSHCNRSSCKKIVLMCHLLFKIHSNSKMRFFHCEKGDLRYNSEQESCDPKNCQVAIEVPQETSRWQESVVVGPPPQSVLVLHFPIHMMVERPFAPGPSIPLEGCLLPKGVLMQDHAICQNWGSKLVARHLQSQSPHPLHLRHLPDDIAVRYPPAPSLGLQQQSHQPDVQSARGLEMEPTNEVDLKIVLGVLSPCYIYGRFAYLYSTKESVYNLV